MTFDANAIFVCDALTLLERLPSDTVTLSYLDPPWNTRSGFSREPSAEAVKASDEQYAVYLSKVVQQVRRLLKNNGSLFVNWSSISPLDVRLVMNQAFGEQPKYEITWHKKGPHCRAAKTPRVDSEFILVYTKSDEFIYNPYFRPMLPDETSMYAQKDVRGPYRLVDITSPFERAGARFDWRGYQLPPRRSWRFMLDKLEALAQENQIWFPTSSGLPRLKQYLGDHAGVELGTTWDDIPSVVRGRERTGYISQKPYELIERILKIASNCGDLVLDPFFGSGTALVAAQTLARKWWGSDNSEEAHKTTRARLLETCSLTAEKDYSAYSLAEITQNPAVDTNYKDVIASIEQISQLQNDINTLNNHMISLKRLMNISENDDERKVKEAIEQMEHWISLSVANQTRSVDNYIAEVCSWLSSWERLDAATQTFLPQAEMLFENISRSNGLDYSPFIIQYCRALENELLTKIFTAYTDDLYARVGNIPNFLSNDLIDKKTGKFANFLKDRRTTYTLGDMAFIMQLTKSGGQTIKNSHLLQDFRQFIIQYFSEHIVDKTFLIQIERINEDFRRKAAHPYVLDAETAERCRDLLRTCLNELILNFKGSKTNELE